MAPTRVLASAGLACLLAAGAAHAAPLYFQGFETDTSGWTAESGGDGNGSITQVPSGGGSLGLTAFQGGSYAEVHNGTNAYAPGYGTGGFSFLNGDGVTPPPYPGRSFSQSISVYINVATPAPSAPGVPAFWIDMSPSSVAPDSVGCFPAACSDEHNFRLTYTGSSVQVSTDGSVTPALTINSSGWYTFQDTYAKGATPSSLVNTDLNIFDASNTLLSSTAVLGDSDGGTLTSSNLAGPGYIWLPVWQDGFSGDLLGIDNVRADVAAPEPPAISLLAAGLICLMGFGIARIQRQ